MGSHPPMSSASSLLLADRYQLADRIAAGSSGEVWRGTDIVLARPVAIKLLQGGYAQHPETLARFRAEARHAGALSHEGIAHVYDYCESEPPHPPFLVMERVDGLSLAEMLAGGPVEPARAMDIIAQAAAGLHAAHLAGLVHRDIKPGNLLLSRGGIVKITDFGISHSAGSAPITSAGMLVGTAGYLAPERLGGARATPASDLYALGVVAYECLAGAAPFDGIPAEIALAHRDRPMPPLPATVPADVAALVTELTAKEPAARPESADAVARRAGRGVVLAAVAVAAVVLALVLTSVLRPAAPHRPVSVPSGTSKPASPAAQLIEVNVGSLIGQPVGAVVRQLHQLGLAVRVLWRPSSRQPSGMVLAVRPGGRVPAGSLVVVTGALQPQVSSSPVPDDKGKGKGKGNGGGNGNGNGKGSGNGNLIGNAGRTSGVPSGVAGRASG